LIITLLDREVIDLSRDANHPDFGGVSLKCMALIRPPIRASRRNFVRRNKTALGLRGQAETLLKIEDLRFNKATIYVV
jgi:hypothetical protein